MLRTESNWSPPAGADPRILQRGGGGGGQDPRKGKSVGIFKLTRDTVWDALDLFYPQTLSRLIEHTGIEWAYSIPGHIHGN